MSRINIPSGDYDAFSARLKEAIPKRPDGTTITVWDTATKSLKAVRTALNTVVNEHDVTLRDHKKDLDALRVRIGQALNIEPRLKKLEEEVADLRSRPF